MMSRIDVAMSYRDIQHMFLLDGDVPDDISYVMMVE
jgi:hypothetical protein